MIKNANAVMANVPVKDVKRENPATVTVIVPAVKKNAAALNKIEGDYAFFGPSVKFTWLCLKT